MQRLALDVGTARIGIAMGSHIPQEYSTISMSEEAAQKIAEIITNEDVSELVVGAPLRSQGEPGTLSVEINDFVAQIKLKRPQLIVVMVDEAFSTVQAEIELKEQGLNLTEIGKRVDQYAAKLILDQYNRENPVDI